MRSHDFYEWTNYRWLCITAAMAASFSFSSKFFFLHSPHAGNILLAKFQVHLEYIGFHRKKSTAGYFLWNKLANPTFDVRTLTDALSFNFWLCHLWKSRIGRQTSSSSASVLRWKWRCSPRYNQPWRALWVSVRAGRLIHCCDYLWTPHNKTVCRPPQSNPQPSYKKKVQIATHNTLNK